MSSRRILWAILALAALPPMLEATSGCGFEIAAGGSTEPIEENALKCACTFSSPGTRQLRIQASSDDAEQGPGATMNLTDGDLDIGDRIVGIRFAGVAIPAGAVIQSAYVQFTADETQAGTPTFTIVGEASVSAATFTATGNDLSGRMAGTVSVPWSPPPWTTNQAGPAQRTPDLSALLQELVGLPGWSSGSAVVLRLAGPGFRTGESFDGVSAESAELVVSFDASVTAVLPICALPGAARDANGALTPAALVDECGRVAQTLGGLNQACGLPSPPTCEVVDLRDPDGTDVDDSFQSDVCSAPCVENTVDMNCSDYDPIAFADCVASGMTVDACKSLVAATNATGGSPVCVASGSPLAFHAFGQRSQCEVAGLAQVQAGDREPQHDPDTAGTLELLGRPCPGGGCNTVPSFDLRMEPITFSVRWASDPTFTDLSASGRGLDAAAFDGSGVASFASNEVAGTATGRRGSEGLAIDASNPDPLGVGVDWVNRTCSLNGTLAVGVGDDGVCTGDGTTVCLADSPDCDAVGGPCMIPEDDAEEMQVSVALEGELVNQPPAAVAGADQTIECNSPAGASFTLNGLGSSDPDQNLVLASWREGSRIGPEVSNGLTAALALGVGGAQSYVLRVIDAFAQTDEDETSVGVVDTTPPEFSISVSPATLWPPNHKFVPITITAVTSDVCDASPAIRLLSITSNESANGSGDGNTSPDVEGALFGTDDRQFKLRAERSGNGSGRIYTIVYEAADDSGNLTVRQTTVSVAHNK